mmetsp:Transcript_12632/g.13098  ORF Transcript_12632/g.13098 Transcript_12632/m.13098 type:complete len:165 (+) Transcript_12632:619-1113(+)
MKSAKTNLNDLNQNDLYLPDGQDNDNNEVKEEELKNDQDDLGKLVNLDEFTNMKDDDNAREVNSKLNFINVGKEGGLGNIEAGSEIYLSEMLVFDYNDVEGEEEENVEEDLEHLKDLEFNFVLKDYLLEFFNEFYKLNGEYLTECLKMLPKKDQETFKTFSIVK